MCVCVCLYVCVQSRFSLAGCVHCIVKLHISVGLSRECQHVSERWDVCVKYTFH